MIQWIELNNFPGYFVDPNGWLAKKNKFRLKPLNPSMNFPYGKNPYYNISVKGVKYVLFLNELKEKQHAAKGVIKDANTR